MISFVCRSWPGKSASLPRGTITSCSTRSGSVRSVLCSSSYSASVPRSRSASSVRSRRLSSFRAKARESASICEEASCGSCMTASGGRGRGWLS